MNFSYEYNNKENYQNETSELESLSLRNKNELYSKKINKNNQNDYFYKKVSKNIIDNYKADKLQRKKYNSKIIKRSIDYLKKLNKTNGFFGFDYSLYLKRKITVNY